MTSKLDLNKYKLFIFDWDGTLVNSLGSFVIWDQLFVKTFYGVDWPIENFHKLSAEIKTPHADKINNPYFRYLDEKFGDGKTPMQTIWRNLYSLAPNIQSNIFYKENVPQVLAQFRNIQGKKLAISTNSERKDLDFYSSKESKTAQILNPSLIFDKILTLNDVEYPKPHPESYDKIIRHFNVNPSEVLAFEDSLSGVLSAKNAKVDIISVYDKHSDKDRLKINEIVNYSINSWQEILNIL